MKKKIIAWCITAILLIGMIVLFIKISPRQVNLTPHSDTEEAWTADFLKIIKFSDRDELYITYMGYDSTQNAYSNGNLWITKEDSSSYRLWVEEQANGESVVISPVFNSQSTGFDQCFDD